MITQDKRKSNSANNKFSYDKWLSEKVRIEKERELAKLKKTEEDDTSKT